MESTDALQILERLNHFYSDSFTQLITLFGILCGVVGFIFPILLWMVQKRLFKAENKEIKNAIQKELREEYDQEVKKISDEYLKREKKYEEKIAEMERKLNQEIEKVNAGVYHVQGNILLESRRFLSAFLSFVKAGNGNIAGNDEMNLKKIMKSINKICLPRIRKSELESDEDVVKNYEKFLKALTDYNTNGRYAEELKNMKSEYKKASQRI